MGENAKRSMGVTSALRVASRLDAWLWRAVSDGNVTDLRSAYTEFRDPESPEQITVVTVLADSEPASVLNRRANVATWCARSDDVGALAVQVDEDDVFVVTAWPAHRPGVYHLAATVPVTDKRWGRIERWLVKAAPSVVPVYLDRRDFEGFVSVLGEFGDVDASRLTGRYREDQSSYNRGWPNPKAAIEALEEVPDRVQLRTMTLTVLSSPGTDMRLRVHLRRNAGATYYGGDIRMFDDVVLHRLADAAHRRKNLFRDKQRVVGQPVPRAVEVRVGSARFNEIGATADLVRRLTAYANSDTAVLHRNPYLHVAVTDYLDGSNFDVFVTSDDKIAVHPGFKASVGALVRLTGFLSEEFEADAVAEEPDAGPTLLEDLFSAS